MKCKQASKVDKVEKTKACLQQDTAASMSLNQKICNQFRFKFDFAIFL